MSGIVLILLALVFVAMLLAGQAAYFFLRGREADEDDKLRRRLGIDAMKAEEEALASLLREEAADTMIDQLGRIGEQMAADLKAADDNRTVSQLVMTMLAVGGVTAGLLIPFIGAYGFLFGLVTAFIPRWRVGTKGVTRAKDLLRQLPDALELMGRAMQAGTGLSETFRLVNEESKDPIASEFNQVYDEIRFGRDWRASLEDLVNRYPSVFDLRLFVSSMLLQRETGGNMIDTVKRLSKLIHQRYAFDAKVKAMTSEARTSGLVLALMPIGVVILVLVFNAEYLTPLVTTAYGQVVLVYCVSSYFMGIFLMRNMARVDV